MTFSIIIPVYNRPDEIEELLESFTHQTYKDFEIVIVEDGSSRPCKHIVEQYHNHLTIQYIEKENSGQGFSRNEGFKHAKGEVFILMDSDCLVPETYLEEVKEGMTTQSLDAFGGPDRAHPSFTPTQKAINYAMTSFFTTGGIRDRSDALETYHPRSFNMGFKKEVVDKIGGFRITRMGEDIEFSERIIRAGFRVGLIPKAIVYHKRRTSLRQFAKQLHFFGRARVNIWRFYPDQLKLVHLFPVLFLVGSIVSLVLLITGILINDLVLLYVPSVLFIVYLAILFVDSLVQEKSPIIGLLAVLASCIQLTYYALGFLSEVVKGRGFGDQTLINPHNP
jgi:glycosyltransferase involved in cell wall biosynthesis